MTTEIPDIATMDLVTETAVDASRIRVRLVGCAEPVNLDDLTAYLDAVRRVAVETQAAEIVLDIRSLDFMSAACLRSLLVWLGESQRKSTYLTRMEWDPSRAWQRRSFRHLVSAGGEVLRME
jgi:hypothetical protein